MADPVRVLVVGLGNMGASHASAYHRNPGLRDRRTDERSIRSKKIPDALKDYPLFEDYDAALAETKPDAVSINTWPNTHAEMAVKAMEAGGARVHGKAHRHRHRGCRAGRGDRQGHEPQAGARLQSCGSIRRG